MKEKECWFFKIEICANIILRKIGEKNKVNVLISFQQLKACVINLLLD